MFEDKLLIWRIKHGSSEALIFRVRTKLSSGILRPVQLIYMKQEHLCLRKLSLQKSSKLLRI